jgi:hypothetical protein
MQHNAGTLQLYFRKFDVDFALCDEFASMFNVNLIKSVVNCGELNINLGKSDGGCGIINNKLQADDVIPAPPDVDFAEVDVNFTKIDVSRFKNNIMPAALNITSFKVNKLFYSLIIDFGAIDNNLLMVNELCGKHVKGLKRNNNAYILLYNYFLI